MANPSPEFRDLLRKTFGFKKADNPKNPSPLPIHGPAEQTAPKPIDDPLLSYAAQTMYNPALPPAPLPPPKPPTQQQVNRGTVGGMDTTGPWGQKAPK